MPLNPDATARSAASANRPQKFHVFAAAASNCQHTGFTTNSAPFYRQLLLQNLGCLHVTGSPGHRPAPWCGGSESLDSVKLLSGEFLKQKWKIGEILIIILLATLQPHSCVYG